MRCKPLLVLAGLASYAFGLPTDLNTRTFGLGFTHDFTDLVEGHSPANILVGISGGAAAALGGGALGCTADSVDISYRKELALWIEADAGFHFDASLKKSILAWCEGSGSLTLSLQACAELAIFIPTCAIKAAEAELYITLDGVFSLVDHVAGVLSATAQAALSFAISLLGHIDAQVKLALEHCASGGLVADLSVEVVAALKAWIHSPHCTLSISLKKTILAWCDGKIEGDVISIDVIPVGGLATISVGGAVQGSVDVSGALTIGAQASLAAFLKSELAVDIDIEVLKVLKGCAAGKAAIEFSAEARAALSAWLASASCSLTVELKATLVFWLSFCASVEKAVSLSANFAAELSVWLAKSCTSLFGAGIHGLISLILSGEKLLSLSLEARAQLAALCAGAGGVEIDISIQVIIMGWLTGCHECCSGPGLPTTTSSLPPSTTTTPCETTTTTAATTTTTTPCETTTTTTTSTKSTTTPCETATTTTSTKSTTTPSDSATPTTTTKSTTTPCETTTTTTSTKSTTTPCETTTTTTESTTTPCETTTTTASPTSTSTPCETHTETSTPCETHTSSTPCETESPTPTTTPCETEGPTTTTTSTPCETITTGPVTTAPPKPTTTKTKKTITLTKTVSVAYCPPDY